MPPVNSDRENEIIDSLCEEWRKLVEQEERFPLWRTLAGSTTTENEVFEAWLYRRTTKTNPERFQGQS